MAFTISHAVLAPIIAKLAKNHLPIAALVLGCMAPDLYRLFTTKHYFEPHQWQSVFTVTLWIGLAFCALWYSLYRPVIYRFFALNDDLNLSNISRFFVFICMNAIAVVIGICTHLIWDGLTHVDFRTFAFHDFLSQKVWLFHHTYPMHRILQIGSSIIALPFIIWTSWHYYQKHQQHLPVNKTIHFWRVAIFSTALSIGLFSFFDYIRHIPIQYLQSGLYEITGRSLNEFGQGFMLTFSLGCILFLFLDRGHRLG